MNRFWSFPLSRMVCNGTVLGNCRAHLAGESRFLDLERDGSAWIAARRTAAMELELEILLDEPEQFWALLLAGRTAWDVSLLETAVTLELRPVDSRLRRGVRFALAYPLLPETGDAAVRFRIAPDAAGSYACTFPCAGSGSGSGVSAVNAVLPEQLTAALAEACGWESGTEIACGRFPQQARFGFGLFWKVQEPDLSGRTGRSEWVLAGRSPLDRREELDRGLAQATEWLGNCTTELNRAGADGWFAAESRRLQAADPAGERGEVLYHAELHFTLIRHAFSALS